ncbi:MAG: hypothetical protein P8181_09690 [bacterium]
MGEQMGRPFDLLLGRKTYEIFAAHWPHHEDEGSALNEARKYVASRSRVKLEWKDSMLLQRDVMKEIRGLKSQDGLELQVHGSGNLFKLFSKPIWWMNYGSRR